jgi:hypothetical protein
VFHKGAALGDVVTGLCRQWRGGDARTGFAAAEGATFTDRRDQPVTIHSGLGGGRDNPLLNGATVDPSDVFF